MKCLNITVLYNDSIPSKIYLAFLYKNGFYPRKIIYLNFKTSKKYNITKFFLGKRFSDKIRESRKKKYLDVELSNLLLQPFNLKYSDLDKDIAGFSQEYCEISVSSLSDKNLIDYLTNETNKTFLFTGGGILKKELLSIKDTKFIHIHPGVVPDIKGSDGLFWSYLLRGKIGYSCFYMNEGIDTGDILHIDEYKLHKYKNTKFSKYKKQVLYRYLLDYYDPCFRAQTFVNLINKSLTNSKELNELSYEKQDSTVGRTYFLMHEKLRDIVLEKMIKEMSA